MEFFWKGLSGYACDLLAAEDDSPTIIIIITTTTCSRWVLAASHVRLRRHSRSGVAMTRLWIRRTVTRPNRSRLPIGYSREAFGGIRYPGTRLWRNITSGRLGCFGRADWLAATYVSLDPR